MEPSRAKRPGAELTASAELDAVKLRPARLVYLTSRWYCPLVYLLMPPIFPALALCVRFNCSIARRCPRARKGGARGSARP